MDKINLIIFPGNFLPNIGGLETHVDEFVKYLSRKDKYNISIFTPRTTGGEVIETIYNNVKVIRYPALCIVPNFPIPKFWTLTFWKMFSSLYGADFDIVMTRTMFFTNSTLGFIFAKFKLFGRKKLIHVEHASDFSKLDSTFKLFMNKLYMKTLGNLNLFLADSIVCVSSAGEKFVRNNFLFCKNKSIKVIYRGFNFDQILKIKSINLTKAEFKNKLILTHVGRLIDGKGVQDTLRSLVELKKVRGDFIFLIIGDGPYKKNLIDLTKKYDLARNVKFIGKIFHSDVISYLKSTDIFITASHTEGLPTVVLDAFFSNTKIIATDVGGTCEILGENWNSNNYSLVDCYDSLSILNQIKILLERKFIFDEKTTNNIKNIFDWEKHVKKYENLMHEVLKK